MLGRSLVAVFIWIVAAQAQAHNAIDLTQLDRHMAGPRAQVLVIGTKHLQDMIMNRPENLAILAKSNVEPTMRSSSPQGYPQMWVGGWETRNLRMVANVRATFTQRPGARVLCIVGASHKPWFDSWLGQLQGVDIVDAEKILK
jgi:hypothetical protein